MDNLNKKSTISDDIDISKFLKSLVRNIKFISIFTLFGAITSTSLSLMKKDVWQGDFQIIATTTNSSQATIKRKDSDIASLILGSSQNSDKTQLEILKSPSVLLPVFNYIKEINKSKGINVENMKYESWVQNSLSIAFKADTSVLEIKYRDSDKSLITKALELISSKYQDYSQLDRSKNLEKTKTFLISQIKKITIESNNATQKYNKFAIENNLGEVDGIFTGFNPNTDEDPDRTGRKPKKEFTNATTRYSYHLGRLLAYESEYNELSTKYKPNTPSLLLLKSKIDKRKTLLRRPTEIFLKYDQLETEAKRLSRTLRDLEDQLTVVNLSIANQQDPWKLISKPKIQDLRYSPKRKEDLLIGTIISFLLAGILTYIRDEKIGIIYEFEDLRKNISNKYLGKLYPDNKEFNDALVYSILDTKDINLENKEIGILSISKNFLKSNNNYLATKYFKNKNIKIINNLDIANIKKFDYLISLYSLGEINSKYLIETNDLLKIFQKNIIGWMVVENREVF